MAELEDLIQYENENTSLDFKAIPYTKDKNEDLIKDVMSMANADVDGNRHIIIGVKLKSSGERDYLGVKKEDLVDQAIYQQLIRDNIEPDITLEYFPFEFDGKTFGIIRISNCDDKPYMMKKDCNKLKKGDSFIRKGSHQPPMIRADLNKIIAERIKFSSFSGNVNVVFSDNNLTEIDLCAIGNFIPPSVRAAQKIKELIEKKEKLPLSNDSFFLDKIQEMPSLLSLVPYGNRNLKTLKDNLENVNKTYKNDDDYEFFELSSHKISLNIINQGDRYIEDASIYMEFEIAEGLFVAKEIYSEPEPSIIPTPQLDRISEHKYLNERYPKVEYNDSSILISSYIGNIKHKMETLAFKEPVRIVLGNELIGQALKVNYRLYGKNLVQPIENTLTINVVPKEE
jgi:hypothetical protein